MLLRDPTIYTAVLYSKNVDNICGFLQYVRSYYPYGHNPIIMGTVTVAPRLIGKGTREVIATGLGCAASLLSCCPC